MGYRISGAGLRALAWAEIRRRVTVDVGNGPVSPHGDVRVLDDCHSN